MNSLTEIVLTGNAYQRGLQHGLILHTQINDFLNDNRARINTIREFALSEEAIQSQVQLHADIIERELPQIAQELRGLAAGANISYEDAVLLQIRVELMTYGMKDIIEGDCSTIATTTALGEALTGQTIDLPGNMTDLGCIFRVIPEDNQQPEILMYGFAGLLGYMGMNSSGLSININMVISDDWQPGVSPYLIVRHLLNYDTTDACVTELKRITRSSSRSLIICDTTTVINVEFTANELQVITGNTLLHTNHFLHPDLTKLDTIHFLFKNSSVKRLRLLEQLLAITGTELTVEILFQIFSDHSLFPVGICAHGEGNIRRSETVAAVVMQPTSFTMYARKGNTCSAITEMFKLSEVSVY